MYKAIVIRFLKGFVAGGAGAAGTFLYAGVTIHSVDDIKKLAFTLSTAFIAGGLLAIEKMYSWNDQQAQ